eukprot:TRINITY_DN2111_c0_g1_i3.p1 TRINITY_DN2111_c0_g1~~TRINITY_DN2111_c0_g1_i3.p1  ORF type:complete len:665 (-),score=180.21 TRINITY_DN2111_c0_g1_i3:98-1993(-)
MGEKTKDPLPSTRKCRDLLFLIIFALFWGGMVVVAVFGRRNGYPPLLVYGVDDDGNICGADNVGLGLVPQELAADMTSKKYLYYIMYPPDFANTSKVCVEKCPSETYLWVDSQSNSSQLICPHGVVPDANNTWPDGPCWGMYKSSSLLFRCFPSDNVLVNSTLSIYKQIVRRVNTSFLSDIATKIFRDISLAWPYILAGAGIALILGIVWIVLMRFLSGFMVWFSIFAIVTTLGVVSYILFTQATAIANKMNILPPELRLTTQEQNLETLRVFAYIVAVVDGIIVLAVLFMFNRIRVAVAIIQETSRAISSMTSILFYPIVTFFLLVGLASYWIIIGVYLASCMTPEYDENGRYQEYKASQTLRYLGLYHLFGGLWTLNVILGIGQCTIAGAIGHWYWAHDKRAIRALPVLRSFLNTIFFHLGSVAFGAFLLALVEWLRIVIALTERAIKNTAGLNKFQKKFITFIAKCLDCCLGCLQRLLKFIDRTGYIMVSVYGYSFCTGVRKGMGLVATNFLRVAAVHVVASFVIFLGKLFICAATCLAAFLAIEQNSDLDFYAIPVILIGIISYAIGSGFLEVYRMGIETILLCFCDDSARNDGSAERPYYMSDALRNTVEMQNKCTSICKCCGCCC